MRGSITASCGHRLKDDEDTVDVITTEEDCDAVDGFHPCTSYHSVCPKCAIEWKQRGWLFETQEHADTWLHAASEANRRYKDAPPQKRDKLRLAYHKIRDIPPAEWSRAQ